MEIWRKPLQFINVMLAIRLPMIVAERGPGRMTAEHDLRVTLQRAVKEQPLVLTIPLTINGSLLNL